MIVGIGVDIVDVSRIQKMFDKYGQHFAERILCKEEMQGFSKVTNPVSLLAKRFAAKEAAAKALGTGMREGVGFQSFQITHDALGKPELTFHHAALQKIHFLKVSRTHITISDEKNYAVGFVTLES